MPGRIIQSLRRVAVNNPVMMLDELINSATIIAATRRRLCWKF
jgi:hypothetical protein